MVNIKIAVLTDSSFDGRVSDYKDLYVIPLMIVTQDNQTYYDDENLSKDKFYNLLNSQVLKTSQTTPGDMLQMWDDLLTKYDQVIFLPISKGLSGQYNTFKMLQQTEEKYENKVFVCDTSAVSVIMQEVVNKVFDWIKQNKTANEICDLVSYLANDFVTYIIPKNLDTLKQGGRISPAAAALAKILKITPILKYDGSIDKQSTARTFKKALKEALSLLKEEIKDLKTIDISYSRTDEKTLELIETIIKEEQLEIRLKSELTNVIASHTGTDTVALVGWKK
ncbi:EDD domain protein, DegV family, putative [synthetic Mycoplasma mycoides JCVI-syn1.0]|uniref:DegV family protein n=1 Tax=Mycoplasma mycoides subsp. capri TaxID=40477 RepID=A0AB38GEB1_MYCMC|nr:DegV family protein [Mycoplasma mycoides]ADH21818.1 EDD domain protein, DegV family, putative [synthetic Mycoplasma mycoides JCVI-syn1.0]AMW76579.1 FakB: Fatty acid kinase subunit [synthetic bacterium JCVI-Syn3.0]AMW77051.1 FakB: Fatty acid kinase subunit [synthetic bacterium JCVI-Syn2.0]AVX54878.1 Fatty acid binding protein [synthetic bacterium JCVI-Syn3A]QWN46116.1 DegV family protein [synthetic bacterium JCVI-Syn3B]